MSDGAVERIRELARIVGKERRRTGKSFEEQVAPYLDGNATPRCSAMMDWHVPSKQCEREGKVEGLCLQHAKFKFRRVSFTAAKGEN